MDLEKEACLFQVKLKDINILAMPRVGTGLIRYPSSDLEEKRATPLHGGRMF